MHFFAPFSLIDLSYLSQLSEGWAYITLGISSILTEELAPLLGGFAAELGHLDFTSVVLSCAAGVFVLSAVLYAVGRWRAAWVRLKLRKSPPVRIFGISMRQLGSTGAESPPLCLRYWIARPWGARRQPTQKSRHQAAE